MKVLQINTVVGTGSVGRITASLYEISNAHGIEGYVAYGRGTAPVSMRAIKIGSPLDMYGHVLQNFLLGESGFGSRGKTETFLKKLDVLQPDLIHLHNIHGFYLQVERLFSYIKDKKIPVVWTLHDCWPMTGHCAYFDYVGCDKWKTGCHHCAQHRSAYPYALWKDNSKDSYRRKQKAFTGVENLTIVTPSQWLAEIVKDSFLKEYPVMVIPNGINREVFRPSDVIRRAGKTEDQDLLRNQTQKQILGVANIWEKRKGLFYFEELARILPEEYHITMVGLNQKQIHRMEKDDQLKKKITAIARTEDAKALAELYEKADVYVNTTLEDNFPTTNLEALACGTPVITFKTGGSPEAIGEDDQIGTVVAAGDVQALADAIITYTKRQKPVKTCRERAEQYDEKICFEKYIELYGRILHES